MNRLLKTTDKLILSLPEKADDAIDMLNYSFENKFPKLVEIGIDD